MFFRASALFQLGRVLEAKIVFKPKCQENTLKKNYYGNYHFNRKHKKTGFNRFLLDVGIGNLTSLIKYKLSECNGVFVDVPLKIVPSQTCPNCGNKKKKELSERVHNCEICNFVADRDVAAAMVMLNYAQGACNSY